MAETGDVNWITQTLAGVDFPQPATGGSGGGGGSGSGGTIKLTRDQRRFNWALKHGVNARKYANERALILRKKSPMDTTSRRIRSIYQLSNYKRRAGRCINVSGKNILEAIVSAGELLAYDQSINRVTFVISKVTPDLMVYIARSGIPLYVGGTVPSTVTGSSRIAFWLPSWNPDYYPCTRPACSKLNMRTLHSVCLHCNTAVYCNERCRRLDQDRHQAYECNHLASVCTSVHLRRLHKFFPPSMYGNVLFHHAS